MLKRSGRDLIALAGSAVGLVSLFPGWLILKPSRIGAGTGINLWDGFGAAGAALIAGLWVLCLAASLAGKRRTGALALGILANLIIIVSFWSAGLAAGRMAGPDVLTRLSPGAGLWTTLAGASVVVFAARQRLTGSPVVREVISWAGPAVFAALLFTGWLDSLSIMKEFAGREDRFLQELRQHVFLFAASAAIGTLIAVPLGVWATRSGKVARPVFFLVNITQTVPSLVLFGLLIAPLSALSFSFPALRDYGVRGVGVLPAMIALVVYSLLPVVRNTYTGLRQIEPSIIDAGRGMGMSRSQVLLRVEVPLASPIVLQGVRIAAVQAVGLATVAALIGAGGLGFFVFQGIGQASDDLILLGAVPVVGLALLVDAGMRLAVRLATPKSALEGAGR